VSFDECARVFGQIGERVQHGNLGLEMGGLVVAVG
jgi:hypothetical protein